MANGSELRISVRADAEQAERKLDEVGRKAEDVQRSAERAGASGGAGGSAGAAAGAGTGASGAARAAAGAAGGGGAGGTGAAAAGAGGAAAGAGAAQAGNAAPGAGGAAAAKEAEALGKSAGGAIAKYFALQFGQQAAMLAIEFSRKAGGGNRAQDYAQATLGGAFQGAAQAGALGFMLGGPLGAAVGIGAGALAGGALGAGQEAAKRKRLRDERERARQWGRFDADYELEAGRGSQAFDGLLSTMGAARQAAALRERAAAIRGDFSGNQSVARLEARLNGLEAAGKGDTDVYARTKELLEAQRRAAGALELRAEGLERNTRLGALAGAFDRAGTGFADAFAAQGITVGATVDTADVQGDMLDELRAIRSMLSKVAGTGADSRVLSGIGQYGF